MAIDLQTARTVIEGARAAARDKGFKPLTVVVLDAGGHVVVVERDDGSSTKRFEIAFGKAHGAIALGRVPGPSWRGPRSSRTSSPPRRRRSGVP